MSDNQNKDKNVILNDEERKLLLDHDYDGIEEFDFPLPSWWVATFVGGVLFAFVYIVYYEAMDGPSIQDEFNKDMARITKIKEANAAQMSNFNVDEYNAYVAKGDMKKAKEVFSEYCVSCHQEGGRGDIGPNLTDAYWLNVKKVDSASLYKVIKDGVEDNGMPAWGEVLEKEELYAAIQYVLSIKDTNIEGGKEPQGEKIE